jgi:hypothetical protein
VNSPYCNLGAARTLLVLALAFCASPAVAAGPSARRQAIDRMKFISELDAATLGLENEFTQPLPKDEASLHGALTVQYVAPVGHQTSQGTAVLQGDALLRRQRYGVFLTPRLKIESLGAPVASASLFLQQAYAFARFATGEVKVGKVVGQLGRLWDYSMYGPIIAGYDFKVAPDLGVSVEGQLDGLHGRKLGYAVQYFVLDGRTFSVANESLLSTRKARRDHNVTVRVVPQRSFGALQAAFGLSAQTYRTRQAQPHQVWRAAADAQVTYRWVEAFIEAGRQTRPDISSMNVPVMPFNYLWAGTQATLGRARLRFHVNAVRHEGSQHGVGILLQPGAEWVVGPWASMVVEGAVWRAAKTLPVASEENLFVFLALRV